MGSFLTTLADGVRPPSVRDYGQQQVLAGQIANLKGQNALIPGQQQIQQGQIAGQQEALKQQQIQTQQQQLDLQDRQGMSKALADAYAAANPGVGPNGQPNTSTPAPVSTGSPTDRVSNLLQRIQDPKYGISAQGQLAMMEKFNQFRDQLAKTDTDTLTSLQDAHKVISQKLNSVLESAPEDQPLQWQLQLNSMKRDPTLSKFAGEVSPQYPGTPAVGGSPEAQTMLHGLMAEGDIVAQQRQANEAPGQIAKSKQEQEAADIVQKLSTPEALAAPGAQAAIQARIADPATDPKDVPRLQALLPKATVAQQQAITQKAREAAATQAVAQGDPNVAGQLLASRALTIDEMKVRGLTPQFQQKAILAAQRIDPNFKAAEASAQGKIAGSQANQSFFGNTDSLLVKGGTLDQLQSAAQQLPAGQIPVFNKVSELASSAVGNTPVSRYAAAVLGVADDYAKVMGGTQGTDTSRQQVLDVLRPAQSPQQLAAAVSQVRQQVSSQREGRVGSNPYLKDMYPTPQQGGAANPQAKFPSGATHVVPGPDGKRHYTNELGTVDYGVAP